MDVEDKQVIDKITRIQQDLVSCGARLKLVEPNNLHITLRFIGEIPEPLVREVAKCLGSLEFKSFKIRFKGIGAFPSASRPRVVWAGVDEGAEELVALSNQVNNLLKRVRLPPPDKEFVPHLTIARVKSGGRALSSLIARLRDIEIGSISVESVRLKKSTLTSRGPIYETLFEKTAT